MKNYLNNFLWKGLTEYAGERPDAHFGPQIRIVPRPNGGHLHELPISFQPLPQAESHPLSEFGGSSPREIL